MQRRPPQQLMRASKKRLGLSQCSACAAASWRALHRMRRPLTRRAAEPRPSCHSRRHRRLRGRGSSPPGLCFQTARGRDAARASDARPVLGVDGARVCTPCVLQACRPACSVSPALRMVASRSQTQGCTSSKEAVPGPSAPTFMAYTASSSVEYTSLTEPCAPRPRSCTNRYWLTNTWPCFVTFVGARLGKHLRVACESARRPGHAPARVARTPRPARRPLCVPRRTCRRSTTILGVSRTSVTAATGGGVPSRGGAAPRSAGRPGGGGTCSSCRRLQLWGVPGAEGCWLPPALPGLSCGAARNASRSAPSLLLLARAGSSREGWAAPAAGAAPQLRLWDRGPRVRAHLCDTIFEIPGFGALPTNPEPSSHQSPRLGDPRQHGLPSQQDAAQPIVPACLPSITPCRPPSTAAGAPTPALTGLRLTVRRVALGAPLGSQETETPSQAAGVLRLGGGHQVPPGLTCGVTRQNTDGQVGQAARGATLGRH